MENFFIGELDLTFPAIPELEISHKNQPTEYFKELVELSKQYWAVPVGILSISVGIGFMYLRKKGSN